VAFETRIVRSPALPCEFEVLADDAVIGPAIAKGGWEDHETRLYRAHLRPGARALDLGANIGWFAVQGVLAGAPNAVAAAKQILRSGQPDMAEMTVLSDRLFRSEEAAEGMRAFAEKRPPSWAPNPQEA